MYDHYVPALIDSLLVALGVPDRRTRRTSPRSRRAALQVMFEYQTAISELTGLPVSNASVYEGPSAVAAAGYLARLRNGRPQARRLAAACTRTARETLRTTAAGYGTWRSSRSR